MKYKTLFRLFQKIVGLAACTFGITSSAGWLGQMAWYFNASRAAASWPWSWWQTIPYSGLTAIALGLYLFFGGRWIANLAIPGNRPYCDECGYDLTRAGAAACPECGTPRADSAPTGPTDS